MSNAVKVVASELGVIGTRAFIVWKEGSEDALLVDFPDGVVEWAQQVEAKYGVRIRTMVLTHGHWDHLSGYSELEEWFQSKNESMPPLYAHVADAPFIRDPEAMRSFAIPGLRLKAPKVTTWWEQLPVQWSCQGVDWDVRHVPGHAPGNILLYSSEGGFAIVGDVIFRGSVGRYDLPFSNWEDLQNSIRSQIYTLPPETVLMPGHGTDTTVDLEMRTNPYVPA